MTRYPAPRALPEATRRALRVLFIAKHARWDGGLHPEDGSHAIYHREMRTTLEEIGLNLTLADNYDALFEHPAVDFVFPLLNRGGFLNSEMLLPLLCTRLGLPYLGGSPILRGLSDDKHLTKGIARLRGVPTAPWVVYRRGVLPDFEACPPAPRYVVKPNASSASWGVSDATDWAMVRAAALRLHGEGHDAIVEPFIPGHDIEVSVITLNGEAILLPIQIVEQDDPAQLRTYQEKRDLGRGQAYEIRPMPESPARKQVEDWTRALIPEFLPFDYGRFEFRVDADSGEVRFLEVNLNCNLWSRKTISMAAAQIGWSHRELIETILTESICRQGLLVPALDLVA